jgi:hypothetical protein
MRHQAVAWTLLSMLFLVPVLGSNVAGPGSLGDPVVELHGQDTAVSLLLECYRQIQASLIQTDYDSRLGAASRLTDTRARGAIAVLADMERYLRQQKLGKQIQRLLMTYTYARKMDEREAGVTVSSAVDLDAAAKTIKDFRPIGNFPLIAAADLSAPIFSFGQSAATPEPLPPELQKYVTLLSNHCGNEAGLAEEVDSLLRQARQQNEPSLNSIALLAISYRSRDGKARDVVVHLFEEPKEKKGKVAATPRLASSRLGQDVLTPVDEWLEIATESQVSYLGPREVVQQRQRAYQTILQADPTLLREQTVEPLHLILLVLDPGRFLPECLSRRVGQAIVEVEFTSSEWRCRVRHLTGDNDTAEQVAALLAGWREIAASVADMYVADDLKQVARNALMNAVIEVKRDEISATCTAKSNLGIRAITKLARWSVQEVPWEDEAKLVTICYQGRTIQVLPTDLSSYLSRRSCRPLLCRGQVKS